MSPESNLKRFYKVKQGVKSCSCGVIHGEGIMLKIAGFMLVYYKQTFTNPGLVNAG